MKIPPDHWIDTFGHRLGMEFTRTEPGAAEVTKINIENGVTYGVELQEGRSLKGRVVISSLDPRTTFLELIGAPLVSPDLQHTAENWKLDKWSLCTLHVVTSERPRYRCDDPRVGDSFMTIVGFESMEQVLEHWSDVVEGRLGAALGGHCTCESFWDPHLVRIPGGHISFFQTQAPYQLEGGWEARAEEITKRIIEKWGSAAPNVRAETLKLARLETPIDIEIRLSSMRRGSIKHGN